MVSGKHFDSTLLEHDPKKSSASIETTIWYVNNKKVDSPTQRNELKEAEVVNGKVNIKVEAFTGD